MDILFAPWRENYLEKTARRNTDKLECPFCTQLQKNNDHENLILRRFKHCFIVMNKYPYNGGHLLVLPLEHVATLQDLSTEARNEFIWLTSESDRILREVLKNEGSNIGLNTGKAGGAGIPTHLHIHVIPRWLGDTNFFPVIGNIKQVSSDTQKIFEKLKPLFDKLKQ